MSDGSLILGGVAATSAALTLWVARAPGPRRRRGERFARDGRVFIPGSSMAEVDRVLAAPVGLSRFLPHPPWLAASSLALVVLFLALPMSFPVVARRLRRRVWPDVPPDHWFGMEAPA